MLLWRVGAFVAIIVAYLCVWLAVDPPLPYYFHVANGTNGGQQAFVSYTLCQSESINWPLAIYLAEAYVFALTLYMSFFLRPSRVRA
jgi:hypothetical protein